MRVMEQYNVYATGIASCREEVSVYEVMVSLRKLLCMGTRPLSTRQREMLASEKFTGLCFGGCTLYQYLGCKLLLRVPMVSLSDAIKLIRSLPNKTVSRYMFGHLTSPLVGFCAILALYKKYAGMSGTGLAKDRVITDLVGYFVGRSFPANLRSADAVGHINFMFITMLGIDVPMDVVLLILAFSPSEKSLIMGFGRTCRAAYEAVQRSWKKVTVNCANVRYIPPLIMQSVKKIRVGSAVSFHKLTFGHNNWTYIFQRTHKNIRQIVAKDVQAPGHVRFLRTLWEFGRSAKFLSLKKLTLDTQGRVSCPANVKHTRDFGERALVDIAPNLEWVKGVPVILCRGMRHLKVYFHTTSTDEADIECFRDFGHTLLSLVLCPNTNKECAPDAWKHVLVDAFPNLKSLCIPFDIPILECSFASNLMFLCFHYACVHKCFMPRLYASSSTARKTSTATCDEATFPLCTDAIANNLLPSFVYIQFKGMFPDPYMIKALHSNNTLKELTTDVYKEYAVPISLNKWKFADRKRELLGSSIVYTDNWTSEQAYRDLVASWYNCTPLLSFYHIMTSLHVCTIYDELYMCDGRVIIGRVSELTKFIWKMRNHQEFFYVINVYHAHEIDRVFALESSPTECFEWLYKFQVPSKPKEIQVHGTSKKRRPPRGSKCVNMSVSIFKSEKHKQLLYPGDH